MPANLAAPPVKGSRRRSSSVAVAERATTGAVPATAVRVIPAVPELIFTAVAPVMFPMVMVFAEAPLPMFMAPVVWESRVRVDPRPELMVKAPAERDHVEVAAPVTVRAASLVRAVELMVTVASAMERLRKRERERRVGESFLTYSILTYQGVVSRGNGNVHMYLNVSEPKQPNVL